MDGNNAALVPAAQLLREWDVAVEALRSAVHDLDHDSDTDHNNDNNNNDNNDADHDKDKDKDKDKDEKKKKETSKRVVVTDYTKSLLPFLATLETILRHGLRPKTSMWGTEKRDYWNWIEALDKNDAIQTELEHTRSLSWLKTPQGKGRAFVRYALMKKSLADTIQLLLVDDKKRAEFYDGKSFLRNEYCCSSLISTLYEVASWEFDLRKNRVDLDNFWTAGEADQMIPKPAMSPQQRSSSQGSMSANRKGSSPEKQRNVDTLLEEIRDLRARLSSETKARESLQATLDDAKISHLEEVTILQTSLRNTKESLHLQTEHARKLLKLLGSTSLLEGADANVKIAMSELAEVVAGSADPDSQPPKKSDSSSPLVSSPDQQALLQDARGQLDAEKERNVQWTKQSEEQSQKLNELNELLKAKESEISSLQDELTRRKEWILEMERSKNQQQETEMRLTTELADTKAALQKERDRGSKLETRLASMEKQAEDDSETHSAELNAIKRSKEEFQRSGEEIALQLEKAEKENAQLTDELNAESNARKLLEKSCSDLEGELNRLREKFENETSTLGEMVHKERKARDEFVNETQKLLIDFQKEVAEEKLRRLQILQQLEAERRRISMQKWAQDTGVTHCSSCREEFTWLRRKHHCRSCGNIFCYACSSKKCMTTAAPSPVRVCDDCYARIQGFQPPTGSFLNDIQEAFQEGLDAILKPPSRTASAGSVTGLTSHQNSS